MLTPRGSSFVAEATVIVSDHLLNTYYPLVLVGTGNREESNMTSVSGLTALRS